MLVPKVLVVDDDVAIREAVADALSREGYEIQFSSDGEQALGMISDSTPDVIILDLRMPGMDGLEFLQRFNPRLSTSCPVIVLTAYADPATVKACQDAGAGSLLEKPFRLHQFREAVRNAVIQNQPPPPGLGEQITGVVASRLEHGEKDGQLDVASPEILRPTR